MQNHGWNLEYLGISTQGTEQRHRHPTTVCVLACNVLRLTFLPLDKKAAVRLSP